MECNVNGVNLIVLVFVVVLYRTRVRCLSKKRKYQNPLKRMLGSHTGTGLEVGRYDSWCGVLHVFDGAHLFRAALLAHTIEWCVV